MGQYDSVLEPQEQKRIGESEKIFKCYFFLKLSQRQNYVKKVHVKKAKNLYIKPMQMGKSGNWQVDWMRGGLTHLPTVKSKLPKTGISHTVYPHYFGKKEKQKYSTRFACRDFILELIANFDYINKMLPFSAAAPVSYYILLFSTSYTWQTFYTGDPYVAKLLKNSHCWRVTIWKALSLFDSRIPSFSSLCLFSLRRQGVVGGRERSASYHSGLVQ